MAPATFETVADRDNSLIRKALKGAVLIGKYGTAPAITTLVATGGQIEMPSTYESLGWISEDGVTFSKDREFSEVRGWGGATYLRRDISTEDHTFECTALETKRLTWELKHSRDLSTAEVTTAGELAVDIIDRPDVFYWRSVALGVDGVGATRFYTARTYHRVMVSEFGEEVWSDGDDPIQYPVTFSAEVDPVTGTIGTEFMFGPGVLAKATAMGFTVDTP